MREGYFCSTDVKGYSSKWKDSIIYPNISFVTKAAYNRKDFISENFTKRKAEKPIILVKIKPWNMSRPETCHNYSIKKD